MTLTDYVHDQLQLHGVDEGLIDTVVNTLRGDTAFIHYENVGIGAILFLLKYTASGDRGREIINNIIENCKLLSDGDAEEVAFVFFYLHKRLNEIDETERLRSKKIVAYLHAPRTEELVEEAIGWLREVYNTRAAKMKHTKAKRNSKSKKLSPTSLEKPDSDPQTTKA